MALLGLNAAHAQTPSILDQLPQELVGVIGSGDQLSLEVRSSSDPAPRIINIGGEYKAGWKLTALTQSQATLIKNGEVRQVGLNLNGAVLSEPMPVAASEVEVLQSAGDLAVLQRMKDDGIWDGAPKPGLNLQETQRLLIYSHRLVLMAEAQPRQGSVATVEPNVVVDALDGPQAMADWLALSAKTRAATQSVSLPLN